MIINCKVFDERMKDRISGEIGGTKFVREQGRQWLHMNKKFRQQQFYPLQFGSGNRNGTILSLSGRKSNSALLSRNPGDWISTKENKKSTCGGTII